MRVLQGTMAQQRARPTDTDSLPSRCADSVFTVYSRSKANTTSRHCTTKLQSEDIESQKSTASRCLYIPTFGVSACTLPNLSRSSSESTHMSNYTSSRTPSLAPLSSPNPPGEDSSASLPHTAPNGPLPLPLPPPNPDPLGANVVNPKLSSPLLRVPTLVPEKS